MQRILIAILALGMASDAFACGPKDALVFSCITTKGKFVEVCQTPSVVTYAFGRKGQKPEMALAVPTEKLDRMVGSGSGAAQDRITFHNGRTSYALEISEVYGRHYPDGTKDIPSTDAYLEVLSSGKTVATIACMRQGMRDKRKNLNAQWRAWE